MGVTSVVARRAARDRVVVMVVRVVVVRVEVGSSEVVSRAVVVWSSAVSVVVVATWVPNTAPTLVPSPPERGDPLTRSIPVTTTIATRKISTPVAARTAMRFPWPVDDALVRVRTTVGVSSGAGSSGGPADRTRVPAGEARVSAGPVPTAAVAGPAARVRWASMRFRTRSRVRSRERW